MVNKTPVNPEDLYKKVVKRFPGVEEKELRIKYSDHPHLNYAGLFLIDEWLYNKFSITVKRPKIVVGQSFMNLDECTQEAVLAHELGHYRCNKRYKDEGLKALITRLDELYDFLGYKKDLSLHREKRLTQWYILHELCADNWVIGAGYGLPFLSFLKNQYESVFGTLNEHSIPLNKGLELSKKSLEVRIKNLEDKLDL